MDTVKMTSNKTLDDNGAGVVRTISGQLVDLVNTDRNTLSMPDIAWGLGRQLRYNGHMQPDYTVAHHSVIMSYYVPREYALEALLHDAAEAYTGDIVHPVKQLMGAKFRKFESKLLGAIFHKFADEATRKRCLSKAGYYKMSDVVKYADTILYAHECFSFADGRPGTYTPEVQSAWSTAAVAHEDLWGASYYPFLHRYYQLLGAQVTRDRINELVLPLWYRPQELDTMDKETAMIIDEAINSLGDM